MKITFVLPFASLSGGIRVLAIYAKHMVALGHDVHVVSQPLRVVPAWRWYLDWAKGKNRFKRRSAKTTSLLAFLGERHHVLDRPRPLVADDVPDADVIVASWWETAEWIAPLGLPKGRKFYLLQDYEMFGHLPLDRVAETYALEMRKIAVSSYIRDQVQKHKGAGEIALAPNAVDLEQFSVPERSKGTPLTVGFLFAENERKNAELAIAALKQAKGLVPELQAVCFGATHPKASMGLPDWVTFHLQPEQAEIPKIYAACDLWLFTSREEGFGLPLLEAMACRTPVLATFAGAAPDVIDGQNGQLLEGAPQRFAEKIADFHKMDAMMWRASSEAAYRTAQAHSWREATARLLRLFAAEGE